MSQRSSRINPTDRLPQTSSQNKPVGDDQSPVSLSFKDVTAGNQFCLSKCEKKILKDAVDFFRQLTSMPWSDAKKSAGLRLKHYDDCALKKKRPGNLSEDIKIIGIRLSRKGRVFGYYLNHKFCILWFDPDHEIVPCD